MKRTSLPLQRREFITLLGGAAAAWPLVARAQQPAMPVIGFLNAVARAFADYVAAFRQGLGEAGFVEGQNVAIEYRWAEGQYDRLPELAADLVRRQVDVIVAAGRPPALAAKAATATIPIVFSVGGDPVRLGLVASLNRPGGNVTGVNLFSTLVGGKAAGAAARARSERRVIAVLVNPTSEHEAQLRDVEEAARAIGQQILIVNASNEREFDAAFATLTQLRAGGCSSAPFFFNSRRDHSLPWQHATRCPRSMNGASLRRPAV